MESKEVATAQLGDALAGARTAVADLAALAEQCGPAWSRPRAPGKWSPSQVTEHVARALEESANVARGAPSKFPTLPAPLRWLLKVLFFNPVLKGRAFPKARTTKALNPIDGPATPSQARHRLETALATFERACQSRAAVSNTVDSPIVGVVPVADFARFQELHVRHHAKQIIVGS